DAATGREIHPVPGHESLVIAVAFSPQGQTVASASHVDLTVRLWDAATGKEIRQFRGHQGALNGVAFSPDGKRLASAGAYLDETVRLWDVQTGKELHRLHRPEVHFYSVVFSPDGKTVALSGTDSMVRLWNPEAAQEPRQLLKGHRGVVNSVA